MRRRAEKYERGEFDDEAEAANLIELYEARLAALEPHGRAPRARERAAKGGLGHLSPSERRDASVVTGPVVFPSPMDAA